jgi:D-glucosaminate-6-phosphate ammonia-lyase
VKPRGAAGPSAPPRPTRVISAAGYVTTLGGGAISPAARRAMAEAAGATWRIDDLQRWAGEVIADATGAQAGWVTPGAAAGLTLAAAACMAGCDPRVLDALPETSLTANEIVVQRPHRNAYDRTLRTAGARLVEVGYPLIEGVGRTREWQLEVAFTERTAAVLHLALADQAAVPLPRVCELARARGVPVIVDAAAELPPAENLRAFTAAGADLVVFSGGKAIRGPQASGILAGRRDLVESVRLQTMDMDVDVEAWRAQEGSEPPHHGLGRSLKVGKEEIVGLVAALQEFVARNHAAEAEEQAGWLESVRSALRSPSAQVVRSGHFYPRLVLTTAPAVARGWAEALARATPPIVVAHYGLARGELVVCPEAIATEDRDHIVAALTAAARQVGA